MEHLVKFGQELLKTLWDQEVVLTMWPLRYKLSAPQSLNSVIKKNRHNYSNKAFSSHQNFFFNYTVL